MADPVPSITTCAEGDLSCQNTAGEPDFTPVLIYGVVADFLVVVPVILYLAFDGTTGYSKHH